MWDDETIKFVTEQWQAGKSASVIAVALSARVNSHVTRNSIIGKVHRLGLMRSSVRPMERKVRPPRPKPYKPKGARNRPFAFSENAKMAPSQADLATLAAMAARDPVARITSILDLEDHHCRWPVGDPKQANFGWCGDQVVPGLSYCESCATRAYTRATVSELAPRFSSIRAEREKVCA